MRSGRIFRWFRTICRLILFVAFCAAVFAYWHKEDVQTFLRDKVSPHRRMHHRWRPRSRMRSYNRNHEVAPDEDVEHLETTLERLRTSMETVQPSPSKSIDSDKN